jgi:hypothetical protein
MSTQSRLLIERLEKAAEDRQTALARLSLQTGLPVELLRAPDRLTQEQSIMVEEAVKRILGTDEIEV